jgi:hypothetical protein
MSPAYQLPAVRQRQWVAEAGLRTGVYAHRMGLRIMARSRWPRAELGGSRG